MLSIVCYVVLCCAVPCYVIGVECCLESQERGALSMRAELGMLSGQKRARSDSPIGYSKSESLSIVTALV